MIEISKYTSHSTVAEKCWCIKNTGENYQGTFND